LSTAPQAHQPLAPHLNPTASQMFNHSFPSAHQGMNPTMQMQAPPKLTDHSLALLNTFKSRDQTTAITSIHTNASMQGVALERRQVPPQELPAEVSSAPPVDLLSMFKVQQPESSPVLHPNTSHIKPTVDDAHRSSLLNLFKGPQRTSLTPRPAATAFPTSTTPSAVELSAVEPLSSNAVAASASSADGPGANYRERNSSIPELHPESNLPFRAMSILARPVEANSSDRQGRTTSQEILSSEVKASTDQGRRPVSNVVEKPFQPQILKRPQPAAQAQAEVPNTMSGVIPSLPVKSSVDGRTSQSADHKQTLLSLFGKAPSPPAPLSQNLTGGSFASLHSAGQTGTPVRTRVGSLASEAPSRSGSQALSPADKSFLLSYLDNVAKGTHL
jgi:mRNA-decapping enzyme subunit 2